MIRTSVKTVTTSGLAEIAGAELQMCVQSVRNVGHAERLMRLLFSYVVESGRRIEDGETIDRASSLLIADRKSDPTVIALGELDLDGKTVVPTVDRTVEIWSAQSELCIANDVPLSPTRFGSLIAVSPGLLERADRVEGIRYPATGVMSGWWLFAAEYDGTADDFALIKPVHTFDVLRANIALGKFLGLPTGFAFRTFEHEATWYEG
jgi:hypothetical protein